MISREENESISRAYVWKDESWHKRREVKEKKKAMNKETRLLDEAIEEMKEKLKEVIEETLPKGDEETSANKGKKNVVSLEDEVPEADPLVLDDQEPYLKELKALGGKVLKEFQCFMEIWMQKWS